MTIDLFPKPRGRSQSSPVASVPIDAQRTDGLEVDLGNTHAVRVSQPSRNTRHIEAEFDLSMIVRRPRVMGGSPIIAGTRVRVSDIVRHYRAKGRSLVGIKRALPFLTTKQIRSALNYYRVYREEVDEEMNVEHAMSEQWRQRREEST